VYLGVGPDIDDTPDREWAQAVVELGQQDGVRVAALGGDVGWVFDPDEAINWQRAVVRTGLFDRVHVDVEVWKLDDWRARPIELGASYLRMLSCLLAVEGSLPLEADIAFHLHRVSTASGDTLETAVMRLVDAVTVLSYRNTVTGADSITDVAASALRSAASVGIPCRLAVETQYLGPDDVSRKQTFHGLGKNALDAALSELDRLHVDNPTYAGMAVHDYRNWRAL